MKIKIGLLIIALVGMFVGFFIFIVVSSNKTAVKMKLECASAQPANLGENIYFFRDTSFPESLANFQKENPNLEFVQFIKHAEDIRVGYVVVFKKRTNVK